MSELPKNSDVFLEFFKCCREVVSYYEDPNTVGNPLHENEVRVVSVYLLNYINYFNVTIQRKKIQLYTELISTWRELFKNYLMSVANDDFSFLQEDTDVIIQEIPVSGSNHTYQINLSKIYQWATHCFAATSPKTEVCGLSNKFRANLAKVLAQVFPQNQIMLGGVVSKYSRQDLPPPPNIDGILGSVLGVAEEIIVESGGQPPDFTGCRQMISGLVGNVGPGSNPQELLAKFSDPGALQEYVRAGVKMVVPKND